VTDFKEKDVFFVEKTMSDKMEFID